MKNTAVQLKTKPCMVTPQAEIRESVFVDIPNAAALVFVSKATIKRMLTRGELTRFKFKTRTLVNRRELLAKIRKE